MANYILLTRLTSEAIKDPKAFSQLNQVITTKLHQQAPEVKWLSNYSILGPYDYLDIFEAPDNETATKVAVIIRSFGHATTEVWPAIPWERFEKITQAAA